MQINKILSHIIQTCFSHFCVYNQGDIEEYKQYTQYVQFKPPGYGT